MKTISFETFLKLENQHDGLVVLNVLGPEEFETQHIPGSENIPLSEPGFEERVESRVPNKDHPIVVYCANEQCTASETAARKLEATGFTNVYDFAGGMQEWKDRDMEVATGVHVSHSYDPGI